MVLRFPATNSSLGFVCTASLRAPQCEVEEHVLNAWLLVFSGGGEPDPAFCTAVWRSVAAYVKLLNLSAGNILTAHCERMPQQAVV